MTSDNHVEKWLPVGFSFNPSAIAVRWLDFGCKALSEPFFNQTVRTLRGAKDRATDVNTLLELAGQYPAIQPAGIIFHVSRCGSTLLCNALRLGRRVVVLSEAHPIGMLFRSDIFKKSPIPNDCWEGARQLFSNAVARLYGHHTGDKDPRLIIKCHAVSMFDIETVRTIWPNVPFVIVIRDPIEVMVSNLAKPGGWLRSPLLAGRAFEWTTREIQVMSSEEYCARGIGRFCEAALRQIDANCSVIDYAELDVPAIYRIADLFNIQFPQGTDRELMQVLGTHSKDPTGARPFVWDHERKQADATQSSRELARRWALPPYQRLKEMRSAGLTATGVLSVSSC